MSLSLAFAIEQPAGIVHRDGRPLAGCKENANIAAGAGALSPRMRVCGGTC